jgi:hypothetical protein
LLIFGGCTEKEIVYVDANGTQIHKHRHVKDYNEIVCDDRGYAYYEHYFELNANSYNLTPIFENTYYNGVRSMRQVLCKEL